MTRAWKRLFHSIDTVKMIHYKKKIFGVSKKQQLDKKIIEQKIVQSIETRETDLHIDY